MTTQEEVKNLVEQFGFTLEYSIPGPTGSPTMYDYMNGSCKVKFIVGNGINLIYFFLNDKPKTRKKKIKSIEELEKELLKHFNKKV